MTVTNKSATNLRFTVERPAKIILTKRDVGNSSKSQVDCLVTSSVVPEDEDDSP